MSRQDDWNDEHWSVPPHRGARRFAERHERHDPPPREGGGEEEHMERRRREPAPHGWRDPSRTAGHDPIRPGDPHRYRALGDEHELGRLWDTCGRESPARRDQWGNPAARDLAFDDAYRDRYAAGRRRDLYAPERRYEEYARDHRDDDAGRYDDDRDRRHDEGHGHERDGGDSRRAGRHNRLYDHGHHHRLDPRDDGDPHAEPWRDGGRPELPPFSDTTEGLGSRDRRSLARMRRGPAERAALRAGAAGFGPAPGAHRDDFGAGPSGFYRVEAAPGTARGKGPKNQARSDTRILADVSECLTDDGLLDASNIEVAVKDGEVTLSGTVDSRASRRRAEDLADSVRGVRHVQNNLRALPADATAALRTI